MNKHPIGILDSGVGGLTVLDEVVRELPHESVVYIGDSLNTPYGTKSPEEIYRLAKRLIDFLVEKEAKVVVVACNAITVSCLDRLRNAYPQLAIIGTVPVVKAAVSATQNKRIGILSTSRTAESSYQKQLIKEFANDCMVISVGTDALVPLIEKGEVGGGKLRKILQQVLLPFQKEKVDVVALGCTHFPFIASQIQYILGSKVQLLDSGGAIARQVRRVLENNKALADEEQQPNYQIFTTGNADIAKKLSSGTIANRDNLQGNWDFSHIDL